MMPKSAKAPQIKEPFAVRAQAFQDLPAIGRNGPDTIRLGGFSGLHFLESKKGKDYFLTVTDRGPNGAKFRSQAGTDSRPFLLPVYQPEVVTFSIDHQSHVIEIQKRIKIRSKQQQPISGLPNFASAEAGLWSDEFPVSRTNSKLAVDPSGIDPEGIVKTEDGKIWIVEEYGPSILELDEEGRIIARYIPRMPLKWSGVRSGQQVLPAWLGQRKRNRGFEAVANVGRLLYVFLQSPLPHKKKRSRLVPVIAFDTQTKQVNGVFAYFQETHAADKIGGATAASNGTIYVIERDGEVGKNSFKKVFAVKQGQATNLLKWSHRTLPLAGLTEANFRKLGGIPLQKSLFIDLAEATQQNLEKVEGIAMINENRFALVTDNDFDVPFLDKKVSTSEQSIFLQISRATE